MGDDDGDDNEPNLALVSSRDDSWTPLHPTHLVPSSPLNVRIRAHISFPNLKHCGIGVEQWVRGQGKQLGQMLRTDFADDRGRFPHLIQQAAPMLVGSPLVPGSLPWKQRPCPPRAPSGRNADDKQEGNGTCGDAKKRLHRLAIGLSRNPDCFIATTRRAAFASVD